MSYKTTLVFTSSNELVKLATETKTHTKFRLPYSKKTTSEKGVFFVTKVFYQVVHHVNN